MTGEEIDLIIKYRKLNPHWKVHVLECVEAAETLVMKVDSHTLQ